MRLPFALRRALSPMIGVVPVRIRGGPNEGCRWSLAAAGRHIRGAFETDRVEALAALVREGECAWDVGAHHGYVTLALSRALGPAGRLYAFEPSPYNLRYLRRHVRWNGLSNVEVVPVALGGRDGVARFGGGGSSQAFRLGAGTAAVEVRTVRALLSGGTPAPDLLKLDVEGAESEVLEAAAEHLPSRTAVVTAIHSRPGYERVAAALSAQGFALLESVDVRRLRERDGWGSDDPDLLAVRPARRELLDRARRLAYYAP